MSRLLAQSFRTSTPRVIGVELDLIGLTLSFWIDGKPLTDMSLTVPSGKAWIPTVHFLEKDLEVTLNPYCVSSDAAYSGGLVTKAASGLHADSWSGGQHSYPACLSQPMDTLQAAFLASELDTLLVACVASTSSDKNLQDQKEVNLIKQLETLATQGELDEKWEAAMLYAEELKGEEPESPSEKAEPQPEVPVLPKFESRLIASGEAPVTEEKKSSEEGKAPQTQYILLKFRTDQEALKYLSMAKQKKSTHRFLTSHHLSKLLLNSTQVKKEDKADPALSRHFPQLPSIEKLAQELHQVLLSSDVLA